MIWLKKAWAWLKAYWYVPLLLIGILVMSLVAYGKHTKLTKLLKNKQKAYQKEKKVIEEAAKKKEEVKEENRKEYEKTVKELDEKYEVKKELLKKRQKKKLKKIIADHKNDSDKLAKSISKEFGIKYVKK